MFTAGHLTADNLAWSAEIVQVLGRIVAGVNIRMVSFDIGWTNHNTPVRFLRG